MELTQRYSSWVTKFGFLELLGAVLARVFQGTVPIVRHPPPVR